MDGATTFLERVCAALQAADVDYAVAGGHAVALHGAVRGSIDVDVVLRWTKRTLERAEAALGGMGLVSRLPVTAASVFDNRDEYIQRRNMIAWNFHNPRNPVEQVDILITHDLAAAHAVEIEAESGPVRVLAIDDLIAMKRESDRVQDAADVHALERLR